jgi:toxin ParE1/3/4
VKLRWTVPALRDLESIGDYLARENPQAARKIVTRIFDQVNLLATHPEAGRPGRVAGTRELVVSRTPFIATYRLRDGQVEILAVFHGSRRWPEGFG